MNAYVRELGVELKRADDTWPGAKEQEEAFLADVRKKSSADIEQVEKAIELIKLYHGAVTRKSGEPYYLHPLAVAHIVLDWNQEEATILGALLHDTIEDTPLVFNHIDMLFGFEVATIVDYATHFVNFKNSFYMGKLTDFDNKTMLLQATDTRALYVKIADRLHNMRTINGHPQEEKRKAIAKETLEFFVPLAMTLKLDQAVQELLDLSNRVMKTGK
jgi:(p)ppGpp synthase/HD superfamily hydrolase